MTDSVRLVAVFCAKDKAHHATGHMCMVAERSYPRSCTVPMASTRGGAPWQSSFAKEIAEVEQEQLVTTGLQAVEKHGITNMSLKGQKPQMDQHRGVSKAPTAPRRSGRHAGKT